MCSTYSNTSFRWTVLLPPQRAGDIFEIADSDVSYAAPSSQTSATVSRNSGEVSLIARLEDVPESPEVAGGDRYV